MALRGDLACRSTGAGDVLRRPQAITRHQARHRDCGMELVRRRFALGSAARPTKRRHLVAHHRLADGVRDRGPRPRDRRCNGHIGPTDRLPVGEAQRRVARWHVGAGRTRLAEPHASRRSAGATRARAALRDRDRDGGDIVGVPCRSLDPPQRRRHRLAQHVGPAASGHVDRRVVAHATTGATRGWRRSTRLRPGRSSGARGRRRR